MTVSAAQTENITNILCWTCVNTKTLYRKFSRIKTMLSLTNHGRKRCSLQMCNTNYTLRCLQGDKRPVLEDSVKTRKRWTSVVNLKLRHFFSCLPMIRMQVHSNGAVCARFPPLVDQQNNIIIDCFVCNRSVWCILQADRQSPSSGDAGWRCLQVQVKIAFWRLSLLALCR